MGPEAIRFRIEEWCRYILAVHGGRPWKVDSLSLSFSLLRSRIFLILIHHLSRLTVRSLDREGDYRKFLSKKKKKEKRKEEKMDSIFIIIVIPLWLDGCFEHVRPSSSIPQQKCKSILFRRNSIYFPLLHFYGSLRFFE